MAADDWPAGPMDPVAPPARSRALLIVLIIGSVLSLLTILPVAMMAMMSPMASDSGVNAGVWTFIIVAMTFPLALIIGPLGGWIAFAARRERIAWALILSPLAWVLAIVLLFVFWS